MQLKKLTKGSNVYNHHFEIRFPFGKKKKKPATLSSEATTPKVHIINFCITRTFFKKKRSFKRNIITISQKQTNRKDPRSKNLDWPNKVFKRRTKKNGVALLRVQDLWSLVNSYSLGSLSSHVGLCLWRGFKFKKQREEEEQTDWNWKLKLALFVLQSA